MAIGAKIGIISSSQSEPAPVLDPSDYIMQLDGTNNSSITDTVDGVSSWLDSTGNGNDFTQSNTANMPERVVDGVKFDGVDNYLIGGGTYFPEIISPTGKHTKVYCVKLESSAVHGVFMAKYNTANANKSWTDFYNGDDRPRIIEAVGNTSSHIFMGDPVTTYNQTLIFSFLTDRTEASNYARKKIYLNSTEMILSELQSADLVPSSLPSVEVLLGAHHNGTGFVHYFKGTVHEVRYYDRLLDPTEITAMSDALLLKYP